MLRFLVTCAALAVPSLAVAADVTLYELTENVTLTRKNRSAISQLAGTAKKGTPICPEKLLMPGRFECFVNVTGDDDVDRTTGRGPVDGQFSVVVHYERKLEAPDFVVSKGDFKGTMDFGPSLTQNLPYGTVTGTLRTDQTGGTQHRFTGVFLMPFLGSTQPAGPTGPTLRQVLCPRDLRPNPKLGDDFAWVEVVGGQPTGKCIDVAPEQMNLGRPVVRFEITFQ